MPWNNAPLPAAADRSLSALLPYRLTVCGLSELSAHCRSGISHILSILDPEHPDPADFLNYAPHQRQIWRFHDVIREEPYAHYPREHHVLQAIEWGQRLKSERATQVLIHCHAGISRSTATAVILMVADQAGYEAEAFANLRTIRPRSWPNSRMLQFADRVLDRKGKLMEALRDHYRVMLAAHPELHEDVRIWGRSEEIPDALP